VPDDLLPAVPSASVEEMVFDGEVVDEAAAASPARLDASGRSRTVSAILRHLGYVAAGMVVAWRKWRRKRQRHEQVMQALHARGDEEAMLKWREQQARERKERSDRRRAWLALLVEVFKASPWIAAAGLALMAVAGLLTSLSMRSPYGFAVPWLEAARLFTLAEQMTGDAVAAGCVVVPLAAVAGLWQLGRTGGSMAPGWAVTSADADVDVVIDERAVTQALEALRIPQVRDYLKAGLPLSYIVPCRVDGRGTYCEVRLPKGVPAEEIGTRRARLASGLYRLPAEVWPSMGADASHLRLWVADKGALAEGAGPYPLAAEGFTDVFRGLPFGRTLKGDPIRIPVIGRNSICGGMPEQGKSNGARVAAAGYTLDIITELRIFVPDTNFDFEPFKRRCSRYEMGAEDERIEAILRELEELKDELQRRGQLLVDHEQQEVTRELAHAGVGLHPMFVLLEEAHVAIQHHRHGKDVSGLLCDIVKLDRKRGVHMFVSTQAPTKDNMPRDVTRNCSNGIAFAVGDHTANDGLLGQGAYRAGHRATELIPGTDRGTALCKGFSGERSEVVQVHKLDAKHDNDQVTPLVNRALAEMARKGRELPGSGLPMLESRDLLADLAEVTRDAGEPVRLSDLPARLRDLAPKWGEYRSLTGVELRQRLTDAGVRTVKAGNVPLLHPDDLRRALAAREDEG
jgi:S-DNA-T family DNA segregation ATPase FtsK/SpoIIIE